MGGVHTSKGIMEDPAAALEKAAALDLASNPVEEMAALLLPASPYAGSAAGGRILLQDTRNQKPKMTRGCSKFLAW